MSKKITIFVLIILMSIMPVNHVSKQENLARIASCSTEETETEYNDGDIPVIPIF